MFLSAILGLGYVLFCGIAIALRLIVYSSFVCCVGCLGLVLAATLRLFVCVLFLMCFVAWLWWIDLF